MRKVLWIGTPFFSRSLEKLGWEVVVHDYPAPTTFDWEAVKRLAGGVPDVLVLGDKSHPAPLLGVEEFPCLTVFHCVDSHIHSWHPHYARAFDLCSLSLKDHIPMFREKRLAENSLLWLPPFAGDRDRPLGAEPEWDLLFVGTVNPETTPKRHAWLAELAGQFPGLKVMRGDYRTLFPKARLVLNYAERGDLNYRVFEALGCGACLLTPRVGHGMEELFTDGEDLFLYQQDDMADLLRLVERCLGDPDRRRAVAQNGLSKVNAAHRAVHRATQWDTWVRSHKAKAVVENRLASAPALRTELRMLYLHFAQALEHPELKKAYFEAGRRTTAG